MIVRMLAAAVVGGIVMFGLGFLIYGLLLADFMKAGMTPEAAKLMKEPPNYVLLFVSNVLLAWVLAFIFERWASIKTFSAGAIGGALVVLPIVLGIDLQFAATMNMFNGFMPIIVDAIAATVMSAITGGVIGIVLGKMSPAS